MTKHRTFLTPVPTLICRTVTVVRLNQRPPVLFCVPLDNRAPTGCLILVHPRRIISLSSQCKIGVTLCREVKCHWCCCHWAKCHLIITKNLVCKKHNILMKGSVWSLGCRLVLNQSKQMARSFIIWSLSEHTFLDEHCSDTTAKNNQASFSASRLVKKNVLTC